MRDSDFLDIVNSPNDFFDKSEDSCSGESSNSKDILDSLTRDDEFGSSTLYEKPKLRLTDNGGKFKRNKMNRFESDLKVIGQRRTDIDKRMIMEMRETNQKNLINTT